MKSGQIAALTALLSAGAQAAPRLGHGHGLLKHAALHRKRDIVWETKYEIETITIVKTVYAGSESTDTADTPTAVGTSLSAYTPTSYSAPAVTLPSPSETGAPSPAPASITVQQPTTAAPAPVPVTTSSAAPPPVYTTSAPAAPAPAPTTSEAPAPAPAPSSSEAPAPAPSAPSSGGYGGSYSLTGDATHWDVGMGACGWDNSGAEDVVAISQDLFDQHKDPANPANPNDNLSCGQMINIKGANGANYPAKVVDRCTGCALHDLDMSITLFNKVTNNGDGRVSGMQWGSSFFS